MREHVDRHRGEQHCGTLERRVVAAGDRDVEAREHAVLVPAEGAAGAEVRGQLNSEKDEGGDENEVMGWERLGQNRLWSWRMHSPFWSMTQVCSLSPDEHI